MYLSGWPKIYSFYYIIIQEVQTWQTRKCPYCQLVFPTSLIKTHMKNYCLKRGQASSIEAESTDESTGSCDTSVSEAETSGNYTGEEDMFAPDFGERGDVQDNEGEGEELELSFTEQVIVFCCIVIKKLVQTM